MTTSKHEVRCVVGIASRLSQRSFKSLKLSLRPIWMLALMCLLSVSASAQNVGIGTATPNTTALLDLTSVTQGLLMPRMTATQMTAIATPATADLVYNTTQSLFYYYNGTAWVPIVSSLTAWSLTGNAGTNASTNFLGTTDNIDFRIKAGGTQIFTLTASGDVGIGSTMTAPNRPLEVVGDASVNIHSATFRTATTKTGVALGGDNQGGALPTQFGSIQAFSAASGTATGVTLALQADLGGKVVVGDTLPSTMLDIAGDISVSSTTVTPGTTNTALATASMSFVRLTPSGAFSIAGIAGGVDGKILMLYNTSGSNMTILNESGTATAANRINTLTGANVVTTGEGTITLMYSASDSRWIVIGSKL